jgi:hypothetical protein
MRNEFALTPAKLYPASLEASSGTHTGSGKKGTRASVTAPSLPLPPTAEAGELEVPVTPRARMFDVNKVSVPIASVTATGGLVLASTTTPAVATAGQ